MQTLLLQDFGPVRHVELDVNDFLVFIGPQASGKSTISKSVFFFKSLRDDLTLFALDRIDKGGHFRRQSRDNPTTALKKRIRSRFVGFWGTTKHLDRFRMRYSFTDSCWVELTLQEGYVKVEFSQAFHTSLNEMFDVAGKFAQRWPASRASFLSYQDLSAVEVGRREFLSKFSHLGSELFKDDRTPIFIPAARSLLSTLSDQLQRLVFGGISRETTEETTEIDPYVLDLPLKMFVDRIARLKPLFEQSMDQMIEDRKKLTSAKIDFPSVYFAKALIEQILKATYRYEQHSEKLFISRPDKYVKLSFASSGQQEAIWILLQMFLVVLNNLRAFIVIEEPEAHLYPSAQRDITELITSTFNSGGNQVLITTHSPYILSSLNNLLYAHKLARRDRRTDIPINARVLLDPACVGAYYVEKGAIENIIDPELDLIRVERIDEASREINATFDQLARLDES
ncbi:MAG: AAA family ATPase [Sedimentisphaerales bacterium]|jgi:predicted ATP-dependent endonuclease of OLD family|nr:AAA family ATPase [Sedimentisphaerales bacterium]HNY77277.1 AAA family ATPase [Sedimentisphaerales bacterium]HOC62119.1 AAA family ATPase [Sedimentisphaerales bacterium]HOH63494.1 AAA family ATPase [Sedimentisphaerales bacterium]HPY48377.1 AAA family ATPase [Sedimentisphaerales bacterium]